MHKTVVRSAPQPRAAQQMKGEWALGSRWITAPRAYSKTNKHQCRGWILCCKCMETNWESLDVDDSDLPCLTLLRPCSNSIKNHHHINNTNSQHQHTPPLILIPGPAAKIQAAMNRKRLRHDSDPPISTQDFLLQAAQCSQNDDDFSSNAWLRALHFTQSTLSLSLHCILSVLDLVVNCFSY